MLRTRVKICGVMRAHDALMAALCGADAIGMVLYPPAPRNVSLETAAEILAVLPPFVTPVGLFVDATAEQIMNVTTQLGLRHVQLHGNELPETVSALRGRAVIKAVRVEAETFAQTLGIWREAIAAGGLAHLRAIVLETGGTKEAGGTGIRNDWERVRHHAEAGDFAGLPPIIAAGGLNPNNVGAVVSLLRPWAVDVSSGVESARGVKSETQMCAFIEAVAKADAGLSK